jgi:hypothetical protein
MSERYATSTTAEIADLCNPYAAWSSYASAWRFI